MCATENIYRVEATRYSQSTDEGMRERPVKTGRKNTANEADKLAKAWSKEFFYATVYHQGTNEFLYEVEPLK